MLKIKHRRSGFCIESSMSECLIIEFEKDRNISGWKKCRIPKLYKKWLSYMAGKPGRISGRKSPHLKLRETS
jgi:hypothetical protein